MREIYVFPSLLYPGIMGRNEIADDKDKRFIYPNSQLYGESEYNWTGSA
jgi:hypothetical protein